jgi:nitrogen PTS system EIIA component
MQLDTLITPERTLCRAPATSKQQVLESCAQFFCESIRFCESAGAAIDTVTSDTVAIDTTEKLSAEILLQSMLARERLGSTGLGNGIAIPHCRLKNIDRVMGALITLAEPIDFDAIDSKPVDIIFILLAPAQALQEHLNALAALAELCNHSEFRQNLRAASSAEQLHRAAVNFHK